MKIAPDISHLLSLSLLPGLLLSMVADPPDASGADAALPSAWTVDYSRWEDGQKYTRKEVKKDWPTLRFFNEPGLPTSIQDFPAGSGKRWLRVDIPADTFGGSGSGNLFAAELAPSTTRTLEYSVYFPPGWEFSRNNEGASGGGKLPGLSGGSHPSGGNRKPDGMSARPMWRRDRRFSDSAQSYLELYVYWPGQTDRFGDRFFAQKVEAGQTYQIKLMVDLGTPGKPGSVQMWVNGTQRVNERLLFLNSGQDWKLTRYMHNVFYGGSSLAWAPARDQWLLLGPVRLGPKGSSRN